MTLHDIGMLATGAGVMLAISIGFCLYAMRQVGRDNDAYFSDELSPEDRARLQ